MPLPVKENVSHSHSNYHTSPRKKEANHKEAKAALIPSKAQTQSCSSVFGTCCDTKSLDSCSSQAFLVPAHIATPSSWPATTFLNRLLPQQLSSLTWALLRLYIRGWVATHRLTSWECFFSTAQHSTGRPVNWELAFNPNTWQNHLEYLKNIFWCPGAIHWRNYLK